MEAVYGIVAGQDVGTPDRGGKRPEMSIIFPASPLGGKGEERIPNRKEGIT